MRRPHEGEEEDRGAPEGQTLDEIPNQSAWTLRAGSRVASEDSRRGYGSYRGQSTLSIAPTNRAGSHLRGDGSRPEGTVIIAVASGKGGTGKTTVAVNLACAAQEPVRFLDCDVEEPNAHLFLKPALTRTEPVCIQVPVVDEARCTACGKCQEMCRFGAIVSMKSGALVFPELCHGCGGCAKVCPAGAITEVDREIGMMESGSCGLISFVHGKLNVGVPLSPPLVRAVRRRAVAGSLTIVDCPPGTSCPVVAAVRGCDLVVLVTEPTPFGLHDLALAVEMARKLGLRCAVIINRADAGDRRVIDYCAKESLPVLLQIPEDRRIAETYSRGEVIVEAIPEYRLVFARLWDTLAGAHG